MASDQQVCEYFATRRVHTRHHDIYWSGTSVNCNRKVIYSFGSHYPMGVYLGTYNLGKSNEKHLFVKNGDPSSSNTGKDRGSLQRVAAGPTLSRGALGAVGIDFEYLYIPSHDNFTSARDIEAKRDAEPSSEQLGLFGSKRKPTAAEVKREQKEAEAQRRRHSEYVSKREGRILFWREDGRIDVMRDRKTGDLYLVDYYSKKDSYLGEPFPKPKQGQFVSMESTANYEYGDWHTLGAVVVQKGDDYFLCSLDEGTYFVSHLPTEPKNIEHAFNILKPPEVVRAEKKGIKVIRQGEWFFVATGLDDAAFAAKLGISNSQLKDRGERKGLPTRTPDITRSLTDLVGGAYSGIRIVSPGSRQEPNFHEAILVEHGGVTYASGLVYHRRKDSKGIARATGEHKTLDLRGEWYIPYRNTELGSYSVGGTFD